MVDFVALPELHDDLAFYFAAIVVLFSPAPSPSDSPPQKSKTLVKSPQTPLPSGGDIKNKGSRSDSMTPTPLFFSSDLVIDGFRFYLRSDKSMIFIAAGCFLKTDADDRCGLELYRSNELVALVTASAQLDFYPGETRRKSDSRLTYMPGFHVMSSIIGFAVLACPFTVS